MRFLSPTVTAVEDKDHWDQFASSPNNNEDRGSHFDALSSIEGLKSTLKTIGMRISNGDPVELAFRTKGLMNAKDELVKHKNFKKWLEDTQDNER